MLATAIRRGLAPVFLIGSVASAQQITTPKQALGFAIGDDYQLATYSQLAEYWKKLDAESDRLRVVSIGKTAEGRDQLMAIITSPANHARLDRLRETSRRLARAEGLTELEARSLAKEGKAVVWIDGGLHATEVLGAAQLMEHVYQMASRSDEETMRLLDDVVQLVTHANPDGMELVSAWYMRRADPTKRSTSEIPRLYQKYIGHDNNRDLYMNAMPESKNMSRVMYREWNPQIMYNHHQTGPAGAVMFAPPFRDPHNYLIDPILINSLNVVGTIMHNRFAQEDKPGVVQRESASYQTWWNGGLRTTAYFHNMIGILTETIGNPTPITIPVVPDRLVADGNGTFPIMPGPWKFRQSVDYSITANRAILDYASRYREHLLYNVYLMGRAAIDKGSRDHWTLYPKRVAAMRDEAAKDARAASTDPFGARTLDPKYFALLRKPEDRDPRGYVLPSDQTDFLTATKFVNALIESGVDVHRATGPFSVLGASYPAGSYVIKAAQAFRAHVLDLMEPQDYPNDIPYPGGPPKAPYDNAGYTLAMQMGLKYDRIREGFECPCEKIPDVLAKPPVTAVLPSAGRYALARAINDSYLAVNRLLAAKQRVEATATHFLVPATAEATRVLRGLVEQRGLVVKPGVGGGRPVKPVRVGLWDQYGGSMPSGWIRWMLEQFEFPFEVVYVKRLDAGSLNGQFDVLVFVDGAIPAPPGAPTSGNPVAAFFRNQPPPSDDIPAEYRDWLGRITPEKTVPALKSFLEAGGRVVTIGGSTSLARHLNLPVENHLVERTPAGIVRPIPREKLYVPASLLEVQIDSTTQSAFGMASRGIVLFDESPVFRLLPDAGLKGVKPVAWFASAAPLRSGWAWGQTYLEGGIAAIEAQVGKGRLYLYGPEITFRSQPHGTYRFLFNGLLGE